MYCRLIYVRFFPLPWLRMDEVLPTMLTGSSDRVPGLLSDVLKGDEISVTDLSDNNCIISIQTWATPSKMADQAQKHTFFFYAPYSLDEGTAQRRLSVMAEHRDRVAEMRKTGFISWVLSVLYEPAWHITNNLTFLCDRSRTYHHWLGLLWPTSWQKEICRISSHHWIRDTWRSAEVHRSWCLLYERSRECHPPSHELLTSDELFLVGFSGIRRKSLFSRLHTTRL